MNTSVASEIADICVKALRNGNKIFFAGNGGSAADAQHLAAELVGKLNFDRPPLAALALTTDTSILTAIGNDYGFEQVFARQVHALGKAGDVLIGMSTSGNSENVLAAFVAAKLRKMKIIGKTGKTGGDLSDWGCDFLYHSPSDNTQEIQEDHMRLGHQYCGLIEGRMFK